MNVCSSLMRNSTRISEPLQVSPRGEATFSRSAPHPPPHIHTRGQVETLQAGQDRGEKPRDIWDAPTQGQICTEMYFLPLSPKGNEVLTHPSVREPQIH